MSIGATVLFYILVFTLCVLVAAWSDLSRRPYGLILAALILSAIAGFRAYEVGIDTAPYLESIFYQYETGMSDWRMTTFSDGYGQLTCWILSINANATFLLCVEALITNGLITARLWDFKDDASVAYMIFVYVTTAYLQTLCLTCQYIAIAIVFYGTRLLERKHPLLFILVVILAMQLHSSAIIGFLFLIVYIILKRTYTEMEYVLKVISLLLMAGIVILSFRKLVSAYSNYMGNESSVGFMVFVQLIIFLTMIIASNTLHVLRDSEGRNEISANAEKYVVIVTLLGIIVSAGSYIVPNAGRIALYFTLFSSVFYAMSIRNLQDSRTWVGLVRMGLSTWFVLYFIYVFVVHDSLGVMNYSFV